MTKTLEKLILVITILTLSSLMIEPLAFGQDSNSDEAILLVLSNSDWTGDYGREGSSNSVSGDWHESFTFLCGQNDIYHANFSKEIKDGHLVINVIQNGELLNYGSTESDYGSVTLSGKCHTSNVPGNNNGFISLTTDKENYVYEDKIRIDGSSKFISRSHALNFEIYNPNEVPIWSSHVTFWKDNVFAQFAQVKGTLWQIDGEYTIVVYYDDFNKVTKRINITQEEISTEPILEQKQIQEPEQVSETEPIFNIKTDAKNYERGEIIKVSGSVDQSILENQVGLRFINPLGENFDYLATVDIDNTFLTSFGGSSTEQGIEGTYTIEVYYQKVKVAETTFTLLEPAIIPEIKCETGEELVDGECKKIGPNIPPVIKVKNHSIEFEVGTTITFDASPSHDPDGYIDDFEWWFDEEGPIYGEIISRTFEEPGEVEVTIGITDDDGQYVEEYITITVLPKALVVSGGGEGQPTNGPDMTWIIIGIGIAAAAGGAGFAISRSRKSSATGITTTTSGSTITERECNVCGTIIPEGKNICPNCGDTYS